MSYNSAIFVFLLLSLVVLLVVIAFVFFSLLVTCKVAGSGEGDFLPSGVVVPFVSTFLTTEVGIVVVVVVVGDSGLEFVVVVCESAATILVGVVGKDLLLFSIIEELFVVCCCCCCIGDDGVDGGFSDFGESFLFDCDCVNSSAAKFTQQNTQMIWSAKTCK